MSETNVATHAVDSKIEQLAIDYLYANLPTIIVNIAIMPIVITGLFWKQVNHTILITWLCTSLLTVFARYYLAKRYTKLPENHQQHRTYIHYFTLSSLASGIIWGIGGYLLFIPGAVGEQVVLITCIVGLAAGSIIVTSYWLPSFYAYAVPSVGITALGLLTQPQASYKFLALLLAMYLLIIHRVVTNQHQTAINAIKLRFENVDLIEQLTEQKAVAEKANVEKSRFLAAASHDLRQPLHALQLYLSSLSPKKSLEAQSNIIHGMQRATSSLNSLFNTLLDISKLDAGLLAPAFQDFDLASLIKQFKEEYAYQAKEKGLAWKQDDLSHTVHSDPVLLEAILRNLISNAIKYTESGSISITSKPVNKDDTAYISIAIADTGIGIEAAHQTVIYDEYFQVDNPERDKSKGLGLGLAIVKRLVPLLNAQISFESTLKQGTIFTLNIPVGKAAAQQMFAQTIETHQTFDNMQILLIDDEAIVRDSMQQLLEKWGCKATTVEDDTEAMAIYADKKQTPDLIISDYRLRNKRTGAQAINALYDYFESDIPAILISGDTAPERLKEAKAAGFELLHKPVPVAKLKTFIRTHYLALNLK